MKLLKLLIVFAAGVIFTLIVTGNLPMVSHWPLPTRHEIKLGENAMGVAGLIALILAIAFLASRASHNDNGVFGKTRKSLHASETDYWLGGVCGGLGEATPVPAWVWRMAFAIAFFCYGTGGLLYVLLWIFVPGHDSSTQNSAPIELEAHGFLGFLRRLHRSTNDRWLGGICGGLAKDTVIPAWLWRIAFTVMTIYYGVGIGFYILMWIFLPEEKTPTQGRADEPFTA